MEDDGDVYPAVGIAVVISNLARVEPVGGLDRRLGSDPVAGEIEKSRVGEFVATEEGD